MAEYPRGVRSDSYLNQRMTNANRPRLSRPEEVNKTYDYPEDRKQNPPRPNYDDRYGYRTEPSQNEQVRPLYALHEHYYQSGESKMSDPVNVFAVNPVSGMGGGFGGCGGGWGGGFGGGDGIVGGLLLGGLLGNRGFGGNWGGGNNDCHSGPGFGNVVQDTAILAAIGNVQGAIPLTALQTQAQIAESTGDINLSTANQTLAISAEISRQSLGNQQGFANVKDSVQNSFAVLNANLAGVNAAVNMGTLTTAIAIRDDGDKTRALINSIDRDNLSRQLSDANNLIAELKHEHSRTLGNHGIEIQMINNQNQNQQQFQAQAQGLAFLQHGLMECNQLAKATNQNVLVGNSGVTTTGPQTANPTNVKV